jgi:hypothetical protein
MIFHNELTARIADFLNTIGIPVEAAELPGSTFLPGIRLQSGRLLVDESKLLHPADLLHEAGHLALAPPMLRRRMSDGIDLPELNHATLEVGAIAWSYAAVLHLGIDPRVLFHKDGYRGQSEQLLLTFSLGVFPGLPDLENAGLAAFGDRARDLQVDPYPRMRRWLRE